MTLPTKADLPAVVALFRAAADELEAGGAEAFDLSADWTPGPRQGDGHRFTRGGGNGEAGSDRLDEARTSKVNTRLRETVRDGEAVCRTMLALLTIARRRTDNPAIETPQDAAARGYCRSCFTYKKTLTEVYVDPDGRVRYRGLCLFCGRFRADHGEEPPRRVLEVHHTAGQYVTTRLVEQTLAARK